ncbi:MAG: AmmeMemoRadiSam system protein B [Candidatus Omnitrophica bacterium]|nr:AmmeMemoRadiSam system protein B [Candidatus Omnitrophota bacterium]
MTKFKCQNKSKIKNPEISIRFFFVICALVLFCHLCFGICHLALAQDVKQPYAAGGFYPDNPQELSEMIDSFMSEVNPQSPPGEIFALISPHAGYGFSGKVAAYGYKLIKDKPYKTVIIIGPSHQLAFSGISVYPNGAFRTPLGDLEIDKEFAEKLLGKTKEVYFEPQAFEKEHSVEVQLPFLQKSLKDFKIVPIVMGDCTLETCKKLVDLLKGAIGERKNVLVIASTDMYHGYDYEEADAVDKETLSCLKEMDAEKLYYGLREEKFQLCGGFGTVVTLFLSQELGHNKIMVLDHTNSALVTGKKEKGTWTVGYASCVIDQEKEKRLPAACLPAGRAGSKEGEIPMLNQQERKKILEIARKSIQAYLETNKPMQITEADPLLLKELGAFVTLRHNQDLRGCIGNLVATEPLYLTIRDMAIESATGDPRFPPVTLEELKNIEIEISVLSPMKKIQSVDEIQLGKHGVLVKRGFQSGVFLPQVATETGWSKEEFLSHLCSQKAGLPEQAWKEKTTEIYIFTAEVFSERSN